MVTPFNAAAIEAELRRRFDVADADVPVGDGTMSLLRPASADALISEADFGVDERLPYWADVWPSSQVLAAHVARMQGDGRRLLELGCGLGLVSAAAVAAGFDVTATDYYHDALRFAELNVLRHTGRPLCTRHLDWRDLPADLGQYEVIVASDVLYELAYAELVSELCKRVLVPTGEGWVADPGRIGSGPFVDECARRGIQVARGVEIPYQDGKIRQRITLYHLTLPPPTRTPAR